MTPSLMLTNSLTGLVQKLHFSTRLRHTVASLSRLLAPSSGRSPSDIYTLKRLGWWIPDPPGLVAHRQTTAFHPVSAVPCCPAFTTLRPRYARWKTPWSLQWLCPISISSLVFQHVRSMSQTATWIPSPKPASKSSASV